jgi:hypothetical protein
MTASEQIEHACRRDNISFIPHHKCAICGEYVGWYLFHRWPPYEVAFSPTCGCSFVASAHESSWDEIAAWVCDKDGELREEYKALFNLTEDERD